MSGCFGFCPPAGSTKHLGERSSGYETKSFSAFTIVCRFINGLPV